LIASDCIDHTAITGRTTALEGLKQAWAQIYFTFPRSQLQPDDLRLDGDQIALNVIFQGCTPQGKQETAMLLELFRINDEKIVELWNLIRWN
jgi:predicted ester cyclase